MALARFLNDVALAFQTTGNPIAEKLAVMIVQLEIGNGIQSAQQGTFRLH